jgi:hypothetical protein
MNRLRLIRAGLLAVAILMGVVLAGRLLFGPFQILVPVKSALNPEGVFGLAVTLMLLTAMRRSSPQAVPILTRRAIVFLASAVVLITLAGLWRALRIYFLTDDFVFMRILAPWTLRDYLHAFLAPTDYVSFRPIGYPFVGLIAARFQNPIGSHAALLLLHACNAVLVLFAARRMGASLVAAAFAGALFGIHGAHLEGAVWIATSFDTLATFFCLTGFLLVAKAGEQAGGSRGMFLAGSIVCSILAMLSKEAAFVFPFWVLVYVISKKQNLRSTFPFFIAAGLVFAYRWIVLGGIGGYTVAGAARPMVFSLGFDTTVKAVAVRLWSFLYFPINWSVDPSIPLSLLAVIYIAGVVWLAAKTTPSVSLWPALAAILFSIIPPLAILSGSPTLAGSRVLYLPSVWFCILLALALDGVSHTWQFPVAAAIILFHVAALQHNLDSWEYTSAKDKAACDAVARISVGSPKVVVVGKLPGEIRGVQALKNGFPECVDFSARHHVDMQFLADWPAVRADATYLVWDEGTDQLKSMNPPGAP